MALKLTRDLYSVYRWEVLVLWESARSSPSAVYFLTLRPCYFFLFSSGFRMFHYPCSPEHGNIEKAELQELRLDSLPMSRFDLLDGDEIHLDDCSLLSISVWSGSYLPLWFLFFFLKSKILQVEDFITADIFFTARSVDLRYFSSSVLLLFVFLGFLLKLSNIWIICAWKEKKCTRVSKFNEL